MTTIEQVALRPGHGIERVIKGGWQLAGGHGSVDRARATDDMTTFFDAGIRTFDCADIYTGVEAMIGEFIAGLRRSRGAEVADQVTVHTKLVPDLARLDRFGPADVTTIVERSLKRLQIEQLHLVQFYWWDLTVGRPLETLAHLKELQAQGKIRSLGVTNWDADDIAPFVDAGLEIVTDQVQYSLLDHRPAATLVPWGRNHQVTLLCYGALAGGFLTEPWLGHTDPGFTFENRSLVKYRLIIDEFGSWDLFQSLLTTMKTIADKHGVSLTAVALRHVLDQPQVAAVIVGARYAHHLPGTLSVFDLAFDADDRAALEQVLAQRRGPSGPVYGLERDRTSRHGRIMKYNLNTADGRGSQ